MGILLSVQNLEKSFGAQVLFRSLNFGIENADRIGLIGPNGAGKSTLLKCLAGLASPDGGEIVRSRGLKVGYMAQDPEFEKGATIFDAISSGLDDPDEIASVFEWISRLNLEESGKDPEDLVETLSGGWKKRVALARALVCNPALLLLDEPTNHLDLESILWLEDLLARASFATLTITHDRMFLQRVATRIIDLDKRYPDGLLDIRGTYADYLESRGVLLAGQMKREETVSNTLRRETEWLRRGAKARTTKQQARIDRHGDLSTEASDLKARNQSRVADINFDGAERNPKKLVEAVGISKSYDGRKLFGPADLLITPKTRLGLLGPNGSGKSTLIRILLGDEEPDSGEVQRAERLEVAYFAQHRVELDPKASVLQTICPDGDYVEFKGSRVYAKSYLSRFLFRSEQMDMPVEKLSGGEKARLRIAQLMLKSANVLVLDEPTNDLDMATLGELEESLRDFDGAVILVTHDRYFLDAVANVILAFTPEDDSGFMRFADTLQWEAWRESLKSSKSSASQNSRKSGDKNSDKTSETQKAPAATPVLVPTGPKKRMSFKDKRELDGMEVTIASAEAQLVALQSEAASSDNVANPGRLTEIYQSIAELEKKIEKLYARWAELEKDAEA